MQFPFSLKIKNKKIQSLPVEPNTKEMDEDRRKDKFHQ